VLSGGGKGGDAGIWVGIGACGYGACEIKEVAGDDGCVV